MLVDSRRRPFSATIYRRCPVAILPTWHVSNPVPAPKSGVPVLTTARGLLNRQDNDFLCSLVDRVIDEIAVSGRHEFADALDILGTTDRRKKCQALKRAQYRISHRERRGRITDMQILGNLCKVARRAWCEPQPHRSKRRKAASTSSSVANSRRFACASPSITA